MRTTTWLALYVGLMGCSDSGGGSEADSEADSGSGTTLPAPLLTVQQGGIKTLDLSWAAITGATAYKLLLTQDGTVSSEQVGDDLDAGATSLRVEVPVHLIDWATASYVLQACDAAGCSDSEPVSITDFMLGSIGYFKASNTGINHRFGTIALSGDGKTMAVGAQLERSAATGIDGDQDDDSAASAGAVYVFVENDGTWSQQAYIKASNTENDDRFGSWLALSFDGDTLAVSAPFEDSSSNGINGNEGNNAATEDSGAVYVFARTGSSWSQEAYVKSASPVAQGDFARVALSAGGNTLAVGARRERQSGSPASAMGAAYVFTREESVWSQQALLSSLTLREGDLFGSSVSLSADGNTLAVGASGEDSSSTEFNTDASDAGAAFIFTRDGESWSQTAYIKASNAESEDAFGVTVSLSGDGNTLAVGAFGESSSATGVNGDPSDNSAEVSGAVYIYTRDAGAWPQQAYVKASNTDTRDYFGDVTLSDDGNRLVVGARQEQSAALGIGGDQENDDLTNAGAAYAYIREGGVWSFWSYIKAPNTGDGDFFGAYLSLSADGNRLAIGSVEEDGNATGIGGDQGDGPDNFSRSGAVYLY